MLQACNHSYHFTWIDSWHDPARNGEELLKASMAYARATTQCRVVMKFLYKRNDVDVWSDLAKRLQSCMEMLMAASKAWKNTDPKFDFASTAWVNLEQQAESVFKVPEVKIAEDLTDPQQMFGARAQ